MQWHLQPFPNSSKLLTISSNSSRVNALTNRYIHTSTHIQTLPLCYVITAQVVDILVFQFWDQHKCSCISKVAKFLARHNFHRNATQPTAIFFMRQIQDMIYFSSSHTCSAAGISTALCKRQMSVQNMTATVYVHIAADRCHNRNNFTIST